MHCVDDDDAAGVAAGGEIHDWDTGCGAAGWRGHMMVPS